MKNIPVFYTTKMLANSRSISPSANKPSAVVESWLTMGIPLDIREPEPVTVFDIYQAHDEIFVNEVLSLARDNGFDNRSEEVAKSLVYTTGAMQAAAYEAINNGTVAAAPCSGFHHAHWDYAEGFCTFNGLMITAQSLRRTGHSQLTGILDFDQHYGNGTANIIDVLSRHAYIKHFSAGEFYYDASQADEFLARIPSLVESMCDCNVILYQAGADPHIDDPFGGWLTTEQLAERDRLVFESCKRYDIPVAWNLAGGYQTPLRKVLDIHDSTMKACWNIFGEA